MSTNHTTALSLSPGKPAGLTTSGGSRLLLILAFIAIYFIWGTTYLANRFGLDGMKPFVLSTLRYSAAFNWLIRIKPPAIVSTHTYVNPIVAVLLGGIMAGEVLNAAQVLALFMVLTGVLLTNIKFNGSFANAFSKRSTPFDKKLNLAQCEK